MTHIQSRKTKLFSKILKIAPSTTPVHVHQKFYRGYHAQFGGCHLKLNSLQEMPPRKFVFSRGRKYTNYLPKLSPLNIHQIYLKLYVHQVILIIHITQSLNLILAQLQMLKRQVQTVRHCCDYDIYYNLRIFCHHKPWEKANINVFAKNRPDKYPSLHRLTQFFIQVKNGSDCALSLSLSLSDSSAVFFHFSVLEVTLVIFFKHYIHVKGQHIHTHTKRTS